MMKVMRYDVPLFGRSVLAVLGDSESQAISLFQMYAADEEKEEPELDYVRCATGWCQHAGGDVYIWATTPSTLIHEFVHAAFRLCHLVDMEPQEELVARLVQYMKLNIMDEINQLGEVDDE